MIKLFLAGILAETNSFAACPTGMGAFEEQGIRRHRDDPYDPMGILPTLLVLRVAARDRHVTLIEGVIAAAQPLGPIVHSAYVALRDELLAGLTAAAPVDGVVLLLHGAMVSDEMDDCEGDLLARVRAIVGDDVPIGVSLDPHCHLTTTMTDATDLIIAYKEYPHTDISETAIAVMRLTLATARREVKPTLVARDTHLMGIWPTTSGSMADFVVAMRAAEALPGVLSVSLGHGMAYADIPEAGSRMWVITDDDPATAASLAATLAEDLFDRREAIATRFTTLDDAIDRLEAWPGPRALALADIADNPGGGAMGDSTFILRALIERDINNIALGALWDPGAVQICREAGEGATFLMRLGGKTGSTSGDPVDVVATVMRAEDSHSQDDFGSRSACGPSAWVRLAGEIDIVLISRRQQVLGVDLFTGLGIDLAGRRGIVVKSMQHFVESFADTIGEVVYVDTPGLMRADFENIPFKRRSLSFWPREPTL